MKTDFLKIISGLDKAGKTGVRFGIVVVFVWIGALKFFPYEADGIVPFVANSPFMSLFYNHPLDYKKHTNAEGAFVPENHNWQTDNNTYGFSFGLGSFLIIVGLLVALYKVIPLASLVGSVLVFIMMLGTLSFLITTPESWVTNIGEAHSGFPLLSGRGRLVIKDIVMLGGALLTMSETANLMLDRRQQKEIQVARILVD